VVISCRNIPISLKTTFKILLLKATIYPIRAAAPHRISIVARPRGHDWLSDEVSALSQAGIDTLVSMLTDEEADELGLTQESAECRAAGITFMNLGIPDRSVPSDRVAFLRSVEQLSELVREGHHVGVHCRASIGRSSILAVSVLLRLGWDVNAAFKAVEAARGCSVPDTPEQRQWIVSNVAQIG
jgi:protein-tyrosine phosphatase